MTATNWFRTRRDQLGLTQRQIALELGCTVASVSNWERGEALPRLGQAPNLARVYQVSIDDIIRAIGTCVALSA